MLWTQPWPKVRALHVRQVLHDGAPCYLLRDPLGISPSEQLVPNHLAPVLVLCDGTRSTTEIVAMSRVAFDTEVDDREVTGLLRMLEGAAMLEDGFFAKRQAEALAEWRRLKARPMALAGVAYPADPAKLAGHLNALLAAAADVEPAQVEWSRGAGLLCPHIDYARGGAVYARIWKRAQRAAREAEVAVLFGTDHNGDDPVTLTRVPYATPYGLLPTDAAVTDAVAQAVEGVLGQGAAARGELRHRNEHSLELVATWLHHMRGGKPLPIAPILVGGLQKWLEPGRSPAQEPLYDRVIDVARSATAGRRALIIASGDLAHVGPAFGGEPLNGDRALLLRAADRRLLERMVAGDADGFFGEIQRVADANNVCGTAPVWLTMRTLGARREPGARVSVPPRSLEGELLGYRICPADREATSVVTVAGLIFFGAGM